ncbi:MAG: RIP metalloprotease RseP [Fidelibacterota bacterium]|nr:MAG: RIP metalloprotease RseP [Candidatus Neomarinimicrobiota bacterium]
MTTILAMIFVLVVLIFFHELGHYLAARSVGIRVERFYVGFNLFGLGIKKKIGHTEYGLGLIPLGGYVKVAGIVDESMDTKLTGAKWEFQSKNSLQKIWFMSSGVLANLLLAVVIFASLTLANGVAEADPSSVVGSLARDYPAVEAGIQNGDEITAINGESVSSWDELTDIIHARPGETIEVTWIRDGKTFQRVMETRATDTLVDDEIKTVGMIGIGPVVTTRPAGFGDVVVGGFALTKRWLVLTVKSLVMIITGKASLRDVGGPILIAQLAGQSAQSGFSALLGLLAIISINLALINILPIPALDGGHIAIVLIEAALRRSLSLRARMVVQQLGVVLLLTLIVVILYNDIMRIIR